MCDLSYMLLVEQFEGDGRAAMSAGDERSPQAFRAMVDELLDGDLKGSSVPEVSAEVRELREALGVA